MKRILLCLVLAVIVSPAWAAPAIKVNIAWRFKDFLGPVTLYEPKGKALLWETKSVSGLGNAPVGEAILGSSFELIPGHKKRFVMVVQNTTDKPMYFFAAPHTVHPEEDSLGFKFKCLCINHAYTIGPKETWYRIVEFRMSDDFIGDELTITHTLIGIDKKRAAQFSKESEMPEM